MHINKRSIGYLLIMLGIPFFLAAVFLSVAFEHYHWISFFMAITSGGMISIGYLLKQLAIRRHPPTRTMNN
jgi:hypothetical protein